MPRVLIPRVGELWRWWLGGGVVLALGLLAMIWGNASRVDRTKIYRIGYGNDVPLHFSTADGRPTGLAVDLVREAARRRGIELEWVDVLKNGRDDLDIWVLQSIRPWSRSGLHYTEPYLQAESCFLVLEGNSVRDLPDLVGLRISYRDYAIHREMLPQILSSFEAVPAADSRSAVEALIRGDADAAYIDQYTLYATLLDGSQPALRVLPTRSPTRQMAMAARPFGAAVADEIRDAMQDLVADGFLAATMKRWTYFPDLTANIIGDSAQERRRIRSLITGVSILSVLLLVMIGLALLAQRRKNQWQRSEQEYRVLYESMTDAYARFDLQGRIQSINPAFGELLGYPEHELQGQADQELTPKRWHQFEIGIVRADVMTRGFSAVYEKEYIRRDGSVLPVETRVFLLRDDAGTPTGMWSIVRDISERKQAETERETLHNRLAQSQKLEVVGRLAGGVAHDFNNMLQAILGNANLALSDLSPGHPARESLDEILISAERSADLTRQLLAFARKQTIAPKVLDLNQTIESTLKLLRRLIGEGINLVWRPGAELWPVSIDPGQLNQILTNLCVNARDAIDGAGRIQLESANVRVDAGQAAQLPGLVPGEFVMMSVSDDGRGMDEETQAHLFEPFFTTKDVGEGTGLGLATVYGIVSQNRGGIQVISEPGRGATFNLYLPRHAATEAPLVESVAGPISHEGGSETILLVEDEVPVLRVSQRLLESLGYRVLATTSGQEALALAKAHAEKIHLLLTDVIMPEMNGRELVDRLRIVRPEIRCVFMSGYDANVVTPHGVLDAGTYFLTKPFSTDALAAMVRTALTD